MTDTALAAASAVVGTREALRTDVDGYTEGFRRGLMIASAVSVVAWAFSAYHGYTLSADCRRARTLQTSLMATPRR